MHDTAPLAFGRSTLLVHDYDEALAFYRAAFGATPLFDLTTPDGGRFLHVGLEPATDGARAPWAAPVGWWFLRATSDAQRALVGRKAGEQPFGVLYAADCRAAVERVAQAGGAVRRPPRAEDGAVFAHVADLYGNEYVLVELRPDPA